MKWGFETRHSANKDIYSPTAGGSFVYNTLATNNAVASLLLGWTYSGSVLATEPLNTRAATYGAFIQDDWHVASRLTLNVGLRYDLDTPRWETNNRQNGFDSNALNPVSGTLGVITFSGLYGQSKYAHKWDKNNFGPRLGFAWNPTEKWVIRGGGAVLFLPEYDQATPIVTNTGFSSQASYVSGNNGVTPAFLLSDGFPGATTPLLSQLTPGYGAVPVGTKPTTAITFFDPNRVNGYLYQASFDIQRQLGNGFLADVGYLGTSVITCPRRMPKVSIRFPPASWVRGMPRSSGPSRNTAMYSWWRAPLAVRNTTVSILPFRNGTPEACTSRRVIPGRNSKTTSIHGMNWRPFQQALSPTTTTRRITGTFRQRHPSSLCFQLGL